MELSSNLVSQFVKVTNDEKKTPSESSVYGTVVEYGDTTYVKLDGSDQLTPVNTTSSLKVDDRVVVLIKNHTATVTGNVTAPSASSETVKELGTKIDEFENIVADVVTTEQLEATNAAIKNVVADNVTIREELSAVSADIKELEADNVTINETLTANKADIEQLQADMLTAEAADIKYATIDDLEATDAKIVNLNSTYATFEKTTTEKLQANEASIKDLEANKLSATDADIKYAKVDFANITEAAVTKIFSESGIIKDLVVSDGHITGELVGVTIKGDIIEGGTVKADKLVIKGSDGLYYKLNTNGESVEAEQTEYNSLDGSIITAKSITATKISVDDLVAFGATIGGFHIATNSLYSGAKASVDNGTPGVYLDSEGQIAFGDADRYLKYYKDGDEWKLAISADSVTIGTSKKTIENYVDEAVQTQIDAITPNIKDGEDATVLRIDSSRGTVFKNSAVSTVLKVTIYHGSYRITDITTLHEVFGSGAYLEWSWQRMDEETFGVISSTDTRLSQNGFAFTLSPEDVDAKATFSCTLHV